MGVGIQGLGRFLWVCLQGLGASKGVGQTPGYTCDTTGYGQQAVETYPTRMLSCLFT